jgi:hypothetical protein
VSSLKDLKAPLAVILKVEVKSALRSHRVSGIAHSRAVAMNNDGSGNCACERGGNGKGLHGPSVALSTVARKLVSYEVEPNALRFDPL